MIGLEMRDFLKIDAQADDTVCHLVTNLLEQQAQLADRQLNQTLLVELVEQFVVSERQLEKAHQALVALSRTDGLTGIANRRSFDETLDHELARARRSGAPLGLLLMDIDCFKLFNDHYGHAAGDDCLRQVAKAIRSAIHRPPDLAARYGGEELACILPDTGLAGAGMVGEKILAAVRALDIPHVFSKAEKIVTISMGAVALVPDAELTPLKMIEAVDKLLYTAKETGRNRLVCQ